MGDEQSDGSASDWDWAVTVAGRVALCVVGVLAIGAVGVGFALGRWAAGLGWFG